MPLKSIRLNVHLRNEIAENIEEAYRKENPCPAVNDDQTERLHAALNTYAQDLYKADIKALKSLPEHLRKLMTRQETLAFKNFGGYIQTFDLVDSAGEPVSVPLEWSERCVISLERDEKGGVKHLPKVFQDLYHAFKKEKKRIKAEYEAACKWEKELQLYMDDVRNVLAGVNTSKQLLEVWPEVEKFLPKSANDPSAIKLPAVSITRLNRALGTP